MCSRTHFASTSTADVDQGAESGTYAAWQRDTSNVHACGLDDEDTVDKLRAMVMREADAYLPCEGYSAMIISDQTDHASEVWRRKLCEWCYSVVDHFNFDREVVSYAISYLDRTVAAKARVSSDKRHTLSQQHFQLLAVSSLYLSIKLHAEIDDHTSNSVRRKLRIGAYVELSRGFFTEKLIEKTELDILTTLNWRVNPPSSLGFVAWMLRLCPKWKTTTEAYKQVMGAIFDVARYLTELSLCLSSCSFFNKTSVIAYAAILYSMDHLPHFPNFQMNLPIDTRTLFLDNLTNVVGLTPTAPEVQTVYRQLEKMCPDLFRSFQLGQDDFESNANSVSDVCTDGKASPVCVTDNLVTQNDHKSTTERLVAHSTEDSRSPRKRCRSREDTCHETLAAESETIRKHSC